MTPIDTGEVDVNGRTGLLEVLRWRRRETALFGRLNALHAAVVGLRIRSVCGAGSRPSRMLAAMPPTMRQRVENCSRGLSAAVPRDQPVSRRDS